MIYITYLLGPNYSLLERYKINKALFSVLLILYPLVDLLRVFILRIKDGKSPFIADKRHLHHLFFTLVKKQILVVVIIFFLSLGSIYIGFLI